MSIDDSFGVALRAANIGSKVFYAVASLSAVLVISPEHGIVSVLHPLLIVGALLSVACTVVISIYQVQGNRQLRAAQLSDALGADTGEESREGYFASPLGKSMLRLASTTLQNSYFTKGILSAMVLRERIRTGVFLIIMVLLFSFRWTTTEWLLLLAQTIFSADLILFWIRMERYQMRTAQVYERLLQFFQQCGTVDTPNGMALVLSAFADYECAKDEAAMPIDQQLFKSLNHSLSKKWEALVKALKLSDEAKSHLDSSH
jgi:hypothetical protein